MRLDHPPGFTGPATPTERKRSKDSPVLPVSSPANQLSFTLSFRLSRLHLSSDTGIRVLPRCHRVPPPRLCGPASSSSPNHQELVVHRRRIPAAARIGRSRNEIRERRRRRFQLRNFATAFRASRDAVHAPTNTTTTSTTTLALVTNSESQRPNERRRSTPATHDSVDEREHEHRPLIPRHRHRDGPDDKPPARNQHQDQDWSSVQARYLDQLREQEDRHEVLSARLAGQTNSLPQSGRRAIGRTKGGRRTCRSSRASRSEDSSCSEEADDTKNINSKQFADNVKVLSAPATSVPSVDVLAYTAYNDDANDNGIERGPSDSDRRQPVARDESAVPIRDRNLDRKRAREERKVERGDESSFVVRTDPIDRGVLSERSDRDFRPWSIDKKKKRKQSAEEHGRGQRGIRTDNTARSQHSITEANGGGEDEGGISGSVGTSEDRESASRIKGPTRKLRPRARKHGLLFILYLLAWPLLCSTNPSGQFATAFAQKPSLSHGENLAQRNATLAQYSSFLSSTVAHQHHQQQQSPDRPGESDPGGHHHHRRDEQHLQQQQQDEPKHQQQNKEHAKSQEQLDEVVQREQESQLELVTHEGSSEGGQGAIGSESAHPYNEYTWEVNQINPWLSACDLAGPAPADLQGSCGPPEVPKNCPMPCESNSENDLNFLEVIERLQASGGRGSPTGRRGKSTRAPQGSPVDPESSPTDGTNTKKKKKKRQGEESEARNRMQGDRGNLDAGVRTAPEQCLFYLEESHKKDVCQVGFGQTSTRSFLTPRENRYWFMSGLRLRHCCEHAVVNALAPGKGGPLEDVLNGGQKCADALDKLLLVDALAARLHCEFEEVLARYDCAQPYSVIHNCTHCKEAYRKWVCSSLVPYFAHGGPEDLESLKGSWTGSRLRPCRFFCQSVEQRCPYLLPGDRAPAYPTQYAGEPTFLCRDPNIPETGEQAARALHSSEEDECCFHVCSEEAPGSGICANCTEREPRKRGRSRDPPTAPHCETNPIQSLPTGQQYPILEGAGTETSTEGIGDEEDSSMSSMPSAPIMYPQQGASLCGSGGVGSMTIASSSSRASSPSLFLWLSSIFLLFLGHLRSTPSALHRTQPTTQQASTGSAFSSPRIRRTTQHPGPARQKSSNRFQGEESPGMDSLLKWVMIECRCRGWWWCWWWWWRSSAAGAGGSGTRGGLGTSSFLRLLSRKCADCRRSRWCWWLWYRWRTRRKCAQHPLGPGRHPHGRWKSKLQKLRFPIGALRGTDGIIKEIRRSSVRLRREFLRLSSRQDPP